MRYSFDCKKHGTVTLTLPVSECESTPPCEECGRPMQRNFGADWATIDINTSGCKDHNRIKADKRVARNGGLGMTKGRAERLERRYAADNAVKREMKASGGGHGRTKMTHSIPAELYHGKIRETGDNSYWKDKKNVERHKEWSV